MEQGERSKNLLTDAPRQSPSETARSSVSQSAVVGSFATPIQHGTNRSSDRAWHNPDGELAQSGSTESKVSYQQSAQARTPNTPNFAVVEGGDQEAPNSPSSQYSLSQNAITTLRSLSPEIEQTSTGGTGTSWSIRIPWLRRTQGSSRYEIDTDGLGSPLSFGGSDTSTSIYRDVMNAYDFMNMHEIVGSDPANEAREAVSSEEIVSKRSEGLVSSSSNVTSVSSATDSLADFNDTEWTPPDSSYGAACPICGFLPKKTRRAMELTIIGLVILSLGYLLVTTSIRITNDHTTHGGSDADVDLDDDFYVEWDAIDDAFRDDDYYNDINSEDESSESENDNDRRFLLDSAFGQLPDDFDFLQ